MRHRKFARLARLIGNEVMARGHLELLWEVAYENGDDLMGDAGDLEHLARWAGEPGGLAGALVESGFFELADGQYRVHDLWDHAPDYVRKRRQRESERQTKGAGLKAVTGQCPPGGAEGGEPAPNGRTRAPAPAPSPTETTPPPAPASVLLGREQVLSSKYPKTAALIAACEAAGCIAGWPKEPATRAAVEAAAGSRPVASVVPGLTAAIAETGKPWLGHHLAVILGAAPKPKRPSLPPDFHDEAWIPPGFDVNRWRTIRANVLADHPGGAEELLAQAKARFLEGPSAWGPTP
jgi:hypothetical protein